MDVTGAAIPASPDRWAASRRLASPHAVWCVTLRILLAAAAVPIAVSCTNIRGSAARVGDLDYEVSVARSLHVREANLEPYGQVSRHKQREPSFAETTAYALRGVDPKAALVVPWAGDPHDDGGPIGEYALLYRDLRQAIPAICAYFDPDHEATITGCR